MPEISIIVPVYNTEKYLAQCLDSILDQTFGDFEVICINDGSTDSSLSILLEYANTDSRIKIINQSNQGVSISRNNGISQASGAYIFFLDADDQIFDNTLDKIDLSSGFDMVINDFEYFSNQSSERIYNKPGLSDGKQVLISYLLWRTKIIMGSYLVKRQLIIDNNLKFSKGTKYGEDWEFNTYLLYLSKSVLITDLLLVGYRTHLDSVVHKVGLERFDAFYTRKRCADFFADNQEYEISKIYSGYLLPQGIIDTVEVIYQQKLWPFKVELFLQRNNLIPFISSTNYNEYTTDSLIHKISEFKKSNLFFSFKTFYKYNLSELKSRIYKKLVFFLQYTKSYN